MKKISQEHITDFLAASKEEMRESYKERRDRKIYSTIMLLIALTFITVIILILKSMPEIMEKVIYTIGGVVLGAFGGYGYGKTKNEN